MTCVITYFINDKFTRFIELLPIWYWLFDHSVKPNESFGVRSADSFQNINKTRGGKLYERRMNEKYYVNI